MFTISENKITRASAPIIEDNFLVLHYDEEPILFTGTNYLGNKVVGSFVEDDDERQITRYFHLIVDSRNYYEFINQKISYLDLLKKIDEIYVLDKSFNGVISATYLLCFKEIPADYLPAADSFCPVQDFNYDLNFIVGLKGKIADISYAIPKVAGIIQTAFADLLESILKDLENFNLCPSVYQMPASEGSFRFNFNVNLNEDISKMGLQMNLFDSTQEIAKFLNKLIQYSMVYLPEEAAAIYESDVPSPNHFSELLTSFKELYLNSKIALPDACEKALKMQLHTAAGNIDKLTGEIGNHFEQIEVVNKKAQIEIPIGFLDSKFKEKFDDTLRLIETKAPGVTIDASPKEYHICIYHLNTDTRKGNANIYNIDSKEEMSKPKISIDGDLPLEVTKYTESLHKNKWIKVNAIATRFEDKFKYLDIKYE